METDKSIQEREAAERRKEQRFIATLNIVLNRFKRAKDNILDTPEFKKQKNEEDKTAFDILFSKKGWYDPDNMKKSIGYNTTREILKFVSGGKLFRNTENETIKDTDNKPKEKTVGSSVAQETINENASVLEKQGAVFTQIAANTLQTNVILNDLKKLSNEQKELTTNSNSSLLSSIEGIGGTIAGAIGLKIATSFKPITDAIDKLTEKLKSPFGLEKTKTPEVDSKKTTVDTNPNKKVVVDKPSTIDRAKSTISEKTKTLKQTASEAFDTLKSKADDAKTAISKTASGTNEKLHSIAKDGADFLKKEGGELLSKGKAVAKKIPLVGAGVTAVVEGTEAMENMSNVDALVSANLLTEKEAEDYKEYLLKKQAIRSSGGIAGGIVGGVVGAGVASVATGVAGSVAGEAAGEYLADAIYGDDIKYYEELVEKRRTQAKQLNSNDEQAASEAFDKLYEQQKKIDELKTLHEDRLNKYINTYTDQHGFAPSDIDIDKWKRSSDNQGMTDYRNYSRNLSRAEMQLRLIEQETGYKLADDKTKGVIKGKIVAPGKVGFDENTSPILPSPQVDNAIIPVQKANNEQAHKEELEYHYRKNKEKSQNNVAVQNNNTVNNTTVQNAPMITRNNDPSFRRNYNIGDFSDY
jgi:hypothetical protein|nr:MAG TPA: TraT complement resistance protein [Caudoviricetes sp.]